MSNDVSQKTSIVTDSVNSLTSSISNVCSASCQAPTSNTSIIITDSNVGDITVGSTCKVDAKCTITASVQQAVATKIGITSTQATKVITDLFNDGAFTKTKLNQDLTTSIINNTTQIMETTCQASSSQATTGTFVYVKNSKAGNIAIGSTGSVSANCTMQNLGKMTSSTKGKIGASQNLKQEGMIAAIVIAMVSILMIGGIIVLLLVSTGVLKGMTGGGGGGKKPKEGEEGELSKLENEVLGGAEGEGEGEGGLDEALGAAEEIF